MKMTREVRYGRICKKHPALKGERYICNSVCVQCGKDYNKERHANRTMTVAQEMTNLRSRVRELESEAELLRKNAERFRHIELCCDNGMSKIYGDNWIEVIDGYIEPGGSNGQAT